MGISEAQEQDQRPSAAPSWEREHQGSGRSGTWARPLRETGVPRRSEQQETQGDAAVGRGSQDGRQETYERNKAAATARKHARGEARDFEDILTDRRERFGGEEYKFGRGGGSQPGVIMVPYRKDGRKWREVWLEHQTCRVCDEPRIMRGTYVEETACQRCKLAMKNPQTHGGALLDAGQEGSGGVPRKSSAGSRPERG